MVGEEWRQLYSNNNKKRKEKKKRKKPAAVIYCIGMLLFELRNTSVEAGDNVGIREVFSLESKFNICFL